jgi:hypothetical protein
MLCLLEMVVINLFESSMDPRLPYNFMGVVSSLRVCKMCEEISSKAPWVGLYVL